MSKKLKLAKEYLGKYNKCLNINEMSNNQILALYEHIKFWEIKFLKEKIILK